MKPSITPTKQSDFHLPRDLRLQVQTLRDIGWKHSKIAEHLKIMIRQVQYASTHRPTPQNRQCGRKSAIDAESLQILIDFVYASQENRQLPYCQIPWKLEWDVSEDAIRWALQKEGFFRRLARRKPPISEKTRLLRLARTYEHLNWTKEQWQTILWNDKTWVHGSRHRRIWVTRRPHEEYDPTCFVPRLPGKGGWIFWGCFSGSTKGPCVFWEKEWGKINKESYCEHIVPFIHGWTRIKQGLSFMQDNAPGHASKIHWRRARRKMYTRYRLASILTRFESHRSRME